MLHYNDRMIDLMSHNKEFGVFPRPVDFKQWMARSNLHFRKSCTAENVLKLEIE